MTSKHPFGFESLDVYQLARSVTRWVHTTPWPPGAAHLKDQAIRAADSLVLNLAEGWTRQGKPGENHLRIARGSAGEVFAVLDILELDRDGLQRQHLRRVNAMLWGMLRRK